MEHQYETLYLTVVGVVTAVIAFYFYLTSTFDYWQNRGVPYLEAWPIFGSVTARSTYTKSFPEAMEGIYKQLNGHDYGGFFLFSEPALLVRSPDVVRAVLVKDFAHFHDRSIINNEAADPITAHLFNLLGTRWRNMRTKLTPAFSSGKMKVMFYSMQECADELGSYLRERVDEDVDFHEVLAKFTTDVIGTCAFGLQFNSMKDPTSLFRIMGRKILFPDSRGKYKRMCLVNLPRLARFLKLTLVPPEVATFFFNVVKETVEQREASHVTRNDFMDLLIQLKNKGVASGEHEVDKELHGEPQPGPKHPEVDAEPMTVRLMAAQAFVFFLAGFETSTSTMSFCLYELALNPDIQEKLRTEVRAGLQRSGGKLTYEEIHGMEYLNKVVCETLRKYPAVGVLFRKCTQSYTMPDTGFVIERGMRVIVPVHALHRDPAHYPHPEQFRPERFDEDEKRNRHHYAYLPFGEGPRTCIGQRFGLMQTKMGLSTILADYRVSVCDKTAVPLVLDSKSVNTAPKGGMWLKLQAA